MRRLMSFLTGVLMGSLVGGTLAVLFAPMSGENLRAELRQRGERLRAEVQEAMDSRRAQLEEQLTALRAPRKGSG